MRKTLKLKLAIQLEAARSLYEEYAGRPLDPNNGWAQVPKGNERALYWFGRYDALRDLEAA